jgi:chemotaxis protein MotB
MSDNSRLGEHQEHHDEGEGNWLVSYADMMTLLVGFFVILLSFAQVDQEKFEKVKESVSQKFGGLYERPFGDFADRLRANLNKAGVGDQVAIKTDESGIEVSFLGTAFFNTGSVDFKPGVRELLDSILPEIKAESEDLRIVIEGHTDDVPLASGAFFRNNWELSSIRACRVLDYFLKNGFSQDRLTAVGYGEARPLVPNRDEQGNPIPENQSQNRRVVIKLHKIEIKSL